MPGKKNYSIAVVCDPLYKYGGAERHLSYVLKTFTNKVLYTAYCDREFVKKYFPNVKIKTSFLQYLPCKSKLKYLYLLLQPLAYKSFRFKGYDLILSISIGFAKFVKGDIPHVNICLSPPKFLWQKESRSISSFTQLEGMNRYLFRIYSSLSNTFLENMWKRWDRDAAKKVEHIIAISNVVKDRVQEYYGRESDVIYPAVEVKEIINLTKGINKENWFLYLGRIEAYKGVELAIRACCDAKTPLKIAGKGDDLERMQGLVKSLNAKGYVKFLGFVSDEQRIKLLAKSKALLFPVKDEDFGIVPVEANAAGTPVIAYKQGGVVETISSVNPKTGIFFDKYDFRVLSKILKRFNSRDFKADSCRKQAANFAVEIFQYKLSRYIEDILKDSKK